MTDRATMTAAESAQVNYTLFCVGLDGDARDMLAKGAALTAATFRHYARLAYRAGKAEAADPEPAPVVPCTICRGVRTCDLDAHRSVR